MTTSKRLLALSASPRVPEKTAWFILRARLQDILQEVPAGAASRRAAVEAHLAAIAGKPTVAEWRDLLRDLDFLRIWLEGYEAAAPPRVRSEEEPNMLRVREWLPEWAEMFGATPPDFIQEVLDAHVESSQAALRLVNLRIDNYTRWLDGVRPTVPLDLRMGLPEEEYREMRLTARRDCAKADA